MPSDGSWLTVVDNMAYQGVSVMNRMHMTHREKTFNTHCFKFKRILVINIGNC